MTEHTRHEPINPDNYWRISICPHCGAMIYWYQPKEGSAYPVNVFAYGGRDPAIKRWGNHNNMVAKHDCEDSNIGQIFVCRKEVREEIRNAVEDLLQQQAAEKAISEFSRSKNGFKRSIYNQAMKFLRGETEYKKPFSPKQAMCVIETIIHS